MTEIKIGTITDEKFARALSAALACGSASGFTYFPIEKDGKVTSVDICIEVTDDVAELLEAMRQ